MTDTAVLRAALDVHLWSIRDLENLEETLDGSLSAVKTKIIAHGEKIHAIVTDAEARKLTAEEYRLLLGGIEDELAHATTRFQLKM
jgi:hypothetical protein